MTPELRIRPLAAPDVDDIVRLSAAEFGDAALARETLDADVAGWQQRKSPTVVARTLDGAFAGYARAVPNAVEPSPRPEGQVAELSEIAVVAGMRGQGVATALVERSVKTLRLLGFARVAARSDSGGLARLGWHVLPAGHGRAWIEPFIARDDLWFPDARSGSFSPLLVLPFDPARPVQAWMTLADEPPLAEAEYDAAHDADAHATAAIRAELARHPEVERRLPPLLRTALGGSDAAR
jgi:GNAT superfamily N-acetyltransferase